MTGTKKLFVIYTALLAVMVSLAAAPAVSAQSIPLTPSDDDVNAVAEQLYCPVCENISLDVCDTTACVQWRDLIRAKLADGWTAEQIKDYFVLQYGDRVLAQPPARGFNWLVYLLPAFIFLAGVALLLRIFRKVPAEAAPARSGESDEQQRPPDPYANRVEEALRQKRK